MSSCVVGVVVLAIWIMLAGELDAASWQQPQITPSASEAFQEASATVRLYNGKTTYQVGEEIPLELEFRGRAGQDFYFSTETQDRSGRMWTEAYDVAPEEGFVDPLADLFAEGFMGGGLSGLQPLNGMPFVLHVSLNDWVRFTRPGPYRLVVRSSRLHRYSSQPAPVMTSDPIFFTIVPADEKWSAAQLKIATDLIDGGKAEGVKRGTTLLRYLNTEAAATALVDRYDAIAAAGAWDIQSALIASSHRSLVVSRMEARLDQGAELEGNFLATLARLHALKEVPPTIGNGVERFNRMKTVQAEYEARWRSANSRRPVTVAALRSEMERLSVSTPEFQQQTSDRLMQHPVEAADAFATLPPRTQSALLQSLPVWNYLNRPWIMPALRKIYTESQGTSLPFAAGDIALKKIYELSHDEGRQLILEEIRTGQHQTGYDALAILPDTALPELDTPLQTRFLGGGQMDAAPGLQDNGGTAWLIARYGSSALLPFVSTAISQRRIGCAPETGLLAYLFKHDPTVAAGRFSPGIERARGCEPLLALSVRYWDDHVEAIVIAQLGESDVQKVVDAARLLGDYGSSAARQPLLDRLAQWSAQWRDRADEFGRRPLDLSSPERIENFITNALIQNRQFALTSDDRAIVRSFCLTDRCRTMFSR